MDTKQKNKLFIATFFEEANQNLCELINKLSSKNKNNFKIVPFEKIHITWKFIGDIDLCENKKIFDIVKEYSHIIKSCTLCFNKIEIWPNLKLPRLLSITPGSYDEKFTEYFNNLEEDLYKNLKIKKEKRRFIPHITIARLKSNNNIDILKDIDFEPIELNIKHTSVVQSINDKNGVLYKLLYNEVLT